MLYLMKRNLSTFGAFNAHGQRERQLANLAFVLIVGEV